MEAQVERRKARGYRSLWLSWSIEFQIFTAKFKRPTYDNASVDCEYGKLVQSSNKIPASGDVSGDKYYNSEDREWVHKSATASTVYSSATTID